MLEFVATMPSRPFGAEVLITLDIVSRLSRLVAGATRGVCGECNFLLYPNNQFRSTLPPVTSVFCCEDASNSGQRYLRAVGLLPRSHCAAYIKWLVYGSPRRSNRSS